VHFQRIAAVILISRLFVIGTASAAIGHPTRRFDACAAHRRIGSRCYRTATYLYGRTVHLRGRVIPNHPARSARVLRRSRVSHRWRIVASIPINDRGAMRYAWRTTRSDANQRSAYRFRFRIPRHGRSNAVRVWVLFAE
jgi:hypothetical protein